MLHNIIEQLGLKASLQLIERRAVIQQHDVSTSCNHITQPLQLYASTHVQEMAAIGKKHKINLPFL